LIRYQFAPQRYIRLHRSVSQDIAQYQRENIRPLTIITRIQINTDNRVFFPFPPKGINRQPGKKLPPPFKNRVYGGT
jgi:hypothetical protein